MNDTPVLRGLRDLGMEHTEVRRGPVGLATETAVVCGIEVRDLIKTIVVQRGAGDYVFVLIPGDHELSWSKLRTLFEVSRLSTPDATEAKQITRYERGTIAPFGVSRPWPVFTDSSILGKHVSMEGGAHEVGVNLRTDDAITALGATVVNLIVPQKVVCRARHIIFHGT